MRADESVASSNRRWRTVIGAVHFVHESGRVSVNLGGIAGILSCPIRGTGFFVCMEEKDAGSTMAGAKEKQKSDQMSEYILEA